MALDAVRRPRVATEPTPADGTLPVRLAARAEGAVEECYRRYGGLVLAYLRRHVGPDDAEDVLQRTFVDVWRTAHRYDPQRSLSGWLFTIAHRRAIDALRQRRVQVVPIEAVRDLVGDDGRELAERYAWAAQLRDGLATLPAAQRQALELAYFEGRTQADIARLLRLPIGTVKARMSRATKAMERYLRAAEQDAAPLGAADPVGAPSLTGQQP